MKKFYFFYNIAIFVLLVIGVAQNSSKLVGIAFFALLIPGIIWICKNLRK